MNKNVFTILLSVVLIVLLGLFFTGKLDGVLDKIGLKQDPNGIYQINGIVKFVKDDSVFIEGTVNGQSQFVELKTSESTVIKKSIIKLTIEQIKKGGQQKPETTIVMGKLSEMTPGTNIIIAKTRDNLLLKKQVRALEINYLEHDYPL